MTLNNKTIYQTLMLIASFGILYNHTIYKLVLDWSTDPNFSHGFLVPFVALYMVWYKKETLASIQSSPANSGVLFIILGIIMHIAGNIGAEFFMMRTSLIVTLSGVIIFLFGYPRFKALLIPISYLLIMIPIPAIIWNKIAFPLQLFAATLSSDVVSMIGIPVLREGNILHLANTSLEVVDACSGIRSLTSLLALSGVFAFIAPLTKTGKWILFFSAIPIAVAVNVIRLTITAMMAEYIGPEAAHGFLHDMSGLIVFIAALALVYFVYILELKIEKQWIK